MRFLLFTYLGLLPLVLQAQALEPIPYNNDKLAVDLGVGLWAWPLPMDYDDDGDLDLIVACPDVPYNGIYFFENTAGDVEMPIFKAPVKVSPSARNLQLSQVNGKPIILGPGKQYTDFKTKGLQASKDIPLKVDFKALHGRTRANQWKYLDYDGDGDQDIVIGLGVWEDYGWDNAYDQQGKWKNGPLHGYVYYAENTGTDTEPDYADLIKLQANKEAIDVYGMPSPSFDDFDQDGDLDLICGEFLDGFTYFENTGSRTKPVYGAGQRLTHQRKEIKLDLQMITPVSIDWNKDGYPDLIVGDEDGRVAFIKNTGRIENGIPLFLPPQYFQQQANDLKFGALVTPFSFDWDGDGDQDLICGNTAGYIGFIENLDGTPSPQWAPPKYLEADGQVIRPMAGPNGSIQGPCEAKWGYTTLSVADWNHDGLPDIILNSIWGKVIWYQNIGTRTTPLLTAPRSITVDWPAAAPQPAWNWWVPQDQELATQWRTTPYVIDWNQDGLNDLIMLDHEGYLAFYERFKIGYRLALKPPTRIFKGQDESVYDGKNRPQKGTAGAALQLNHREGGGSGRRKFCFVDWDQDGRLDLLANSVSINFFRNVATQADGSTVFKDEGPIHPQILAGHTTSPTTVDWDGDGIPDLLIGAEDGRFYWVKNGN